MKWDVQLVLPLLVMLVRSKRPYTYVHTFIHHNPIGKWYLENASHLQVNLLKASIIFLQQASLRYLIFTFFLFELMAKVPLKTSKVELKRNIPDKYSLFYYHFFPN